MTIQRKRVAKRLASGLLAGALAIGGLAISGGSVSARTPESPSTNRIAGADRYETSVAVARKMAAPTDGLVIASGETPYDALAAAVLTTANRPLLLVRSNSIPESVADYISDFKADFVGGSPKVYVVGGETAISADVFTAIKSAVTTASDLTPPTVARIGGANRYETAQKISQVAGITSSTDTLIIANGENDKWADSLSAGPLSAGMDWPIVTTTGGELAAEAKAVIDAYLALPGSVKKFVILGGSAAISPAVEEYLTSTKSVPVANVRRIAGADRYMTNVLFNLYLAGLTVTPVDFTGESVALVNGASPWDALSSAGWAAANGAHVVLTPADGGNTYVNILVGALSALGHGAATIGTDSATRYAIENSIGAAAAYNAAATALDTAGAYGSDAGESLNMASLLYGGANQMAKLYIIGGRNAVSDTAKVGYAAVANGDLTATMTCSQGSDYVSLTLSGALTSYEAQAFAKDANEANFSVNSVADGIDTIIDDGTWLHDVGGNSFSVFLDNPATATSVIKFSGWAEGTTLIGTGNATHKARRSIAGATCTPGIDASAPSVASFRAVSGSAVSSSTNATTSVTNSLIVTFDQPVSIGGIAPGTQGTVAAAQKLVTIGASTSPAGDITVLPQNSSGTQYVLKFADSETAATAAFGNNVAAAPTVVTLNQTLLKDEAGNAVASAPTANIGADSTAPTLSLSEVECKLETATDAETNSTLTVGSLVLEPAIGAYKGANGAGWTLSVVNQRGLLAPKMTVDATAKTVTVTADTGYHVPGDLATVLANSLQSDSSFGGAVGGGWKVGAVSSASTTKLTASAAPAAATGGKHYCAMVISSSEPVSLSATASDFTVTVGGYLATVTGAGTAAHNILAQMTPEGTSHKRTRIVYFTTSYLGSGTMVPGANAMEDKSGNDAVLPVAFTAG